MKAAEESYTKHTGPPILDPCAIHGSSFLFAHLRGKPKLDYLDVDRNNDDDNDDESKTTLSRMLVLPGAPVAVRPAEPPDGYFDSTPPCIFRVEMHFHPCRDP